jgi:hypothetical protein
MVHAGHPQAQAVAAAMRTAREGRAAGGTVSKVHAGPIHSDVAGRTDHLPMHVVSGSYVIPADIISAMGQGNTMAGFKVAKSIFSQPFYGSKAAGAGIPYGGESAPYGQPMPHRAAGGSTPEPAPIGFKTAKGSTYKIHEDGTTTRDKAYRPEHGVKEQGKMPRSIKTFYVTPQDATALGEIQTQGLGGSRAIHPLGDGRVGVRYLDGPSIGKFERRTVVTPAWSPSVGSVPVELWKDGRQTHFGNPITELHYPEVPKALGGPVGAVPIVAAGGEYVIHPQDVVRLGSGSLEDGHRILDEFVKRMRAKTIKTLEALPGPKKD